MLKGLEISEVLLSELEFSGRLDSEYYKPSFLKYERLIKSKENLNLKSLSNFLIGPFGSAFTVDNYVKKADYRYIRGKDVKPLKIKDNDNVYMPKADYERLSKYALKENDILVSVVGTTGNAALITKKDLPAIFSCKSTVLRPTEINSVYLLTYINTKYGKDLLLRKERGAIQKGLNLGDLESLDIFIPSNKFQTDIESIFRTSLDKTEQSKQTYNQAENILLQEIGLQHFTPSAAPVNIKSFKDSFGTSGRLDAEYYQIKYDDYSKLIENYSNGSESIATICNLNGKNFKPQDKTTYNYIELSNVGMTGDINGCTKDLGKELPTRARRKVNTGDVIISSIEGSLDSCALITKEYNNALCSTGFFIINSDLINSESLLVLFKSGLMQNVLKQNCSGTILTGLNKNDFLNIKIPKISDSNQREIADLIQQSFSFKKQSEHLLEVAKKAVEIAIEENEEEAIEYIKNQSKLNG